MKINTFQKSSLLLFEKGISPIYLGFKNFLSQFTHTFFAQRCFLFFTQIVLYSTYYFPVILTLNNTSLRFCRINTYFLNVFFHFLLLIYYNLFNPLHFQFFTIINKTAVNIIQFIWMMEIQKQTHWFKKCMCSLNL